MCISFAKSEYLSDTKKSSIQTQEHRLLGCIIGLCERAPKPSAKHELNQ